MINTLQKRVPSQLMRHCDNCEKQTAHAVGAPTYGFKKDTYRLLSCFECGKRTEDGHIGPWDMV